MNKIDFVCFLEVRNCNPNGDIDMDNQPRQNDNGFGYMTDYCIKRKIRDCVAMIKENEPCYEIYIADDNVALETKAMSFVEENGGYDNIKNLSEQERFELVKNGFKKKYYDVRTFGAVVTSFTKDKYLDGQIRGAVQIGFAESLEEIMPQKVTISRVSVQTEKDLKEKKSELGSKWIVPYAVYKFSGSINPFTADRNGFTEDDKELLFNAILKMCDLNNSSSKTGMSLLKMYVFEHSSRLGDCNFNKISNSFCIEKTVSDLGKCGYNIDIAKDKIPSTVTVTCFD